MEWKRKEEWSLPNKEDPNEMEWMEEMEHGINGMEWNGMEGVDSK